MSELMLGGWIQLNVRVPENLYSELKSQATLQDRSVSAVVRRALVDYLERRKVAYETQQAPQRHDDSQELP